jgi:hypothetical protein
MRSAFLVFDLVGRNAGLKRERDARGFIHPKFDQGEEAVGLVVREGVRLVPAGKALKCHFSFGRTWSCTEVSSRNHTRGRWLQNLLGILLFGLSS